MDSQYYVVVVGAGLQGLAIARNFLQLDPNLNLTVIEWNKTIGGVWAEEKGYTGLSTNNLRRTYEYTNFPMDDSLGVKKDEHIPGKCIHEYLEHYSRKPELKKRIQFHTEVNVAEKMQNGWNLQLENVTSKGHMSNGGNKAALPNPAQWNISCAKLIIATGLTSIPNPINIRGRENFTGPVVNFSDYSREASKIYEDDATKSVTVIGIGKSAYDCVYLMAAQGKTVNWIIRGTRIHIARTLQMLTREALDKPDIYILLPNYVGTGCRFEPGIEFRPKEIHADLGIPSADLTSTQKEVWDRLNVRADLEIFEGFPKLMSGPKIDRYSLVVPQNSPNSVLADTEAPRAEVSPWRLSMVPPAVMTRDLVFLRFVMQPQGALRSEISSIWAYAYMYDRIKGPLESMTKPSTPLHLDQTLPTEKQLSAAEKGGYDEIMYDTVLSNRFGELRTPYGYGAGYPDVVFDGIPYLDLLLRDLGLRSWRKGWGWLGEMLGDGFDQADYRGLVEEWKESQRQKDL